jgi:hypothetical protein
MYDKIISTLFLKPVTGLVSNPNYLMLLAFFNGALIMNFHSLYKRDITLIAIMLFFGIISMINFRFWWASLINILLAINHFSEKFPRLANHSNLEFFIGIIILTLLFAKILNPRFRIPGNLVSNIFRISIVTIYFFTGFHKLNVDFFNSDVSCVTKINTYAFSIFSSKQSVTAEMSTIFQWATIFIEMLLPFGLLWKKTRKLSAIVLLFFHLYLGLTVFADFSALACFLILGCLIDFDAVKFDRKAPAYIRVYLIFIILATIMKPFLEKYVIDRHVPYIHGGIFDIGTILFFLYYFRKYHAVTQNPNRRRYMLPACCCLLISLWSMKTYVGLGNSANLTMFSNLVTETSRSNHLLIDTRKTKIFDFEENNLFILKIDKRLRMEKVEGFILPVNEFHYRASNWVKKHPKWKISCTVVYKNDTTIIPDLSKTDFVRTKWWYRYMNFRKIQPEGPCKCLW